MWGQPDVHFPVAFFQHMQILCDINSLHDWVMTVSLVLLTETLTDRAYWTFLYVLQSQKQNMDLSRQAKFASTPSFALFVTLKNVVCKIGEDAEVLMSLYDPIESKFIRSVRRLHKVYFKKSFFLLLFKAGVCKLYDVKDPQVWLTCCEVPPFLKYTSIYTFFRVKKRNKMHWKNSK